MIQLNEMELLKVLLADRINDNDLIKIIKNYGVNSISKDGRSILNYAIIHENITLVKLLLKDESCNVNFQEEESGYSALHFAVQKNNVELVKLLINSKANVDLEDNNGNTPLWRGMFDGVNEKILIILLENGANINKKNKHGIPPKNFLEKSMIDVLQWIKHKK